MSKYRLDVWFSTTKRAWENGEDAYRTSVMCADAYDIPRSTRAEADDTLDELEKDPQVVEVFLSGPGYNYGYTRNESGDLVRM